MIKAIFKVIAALLIASTLIGCFKSPIAKSGGKLGGFVESFYSSKGDMYYVKPILFESTEGTFLHADFTYTNYKEEPEKPVLLKFSLFNEKPINDIGAIDFSGITTCDNLEFFFHGKAKKGVESRYSCELCKNCYREFVNQSEPYISIIIAGNEMKFTSSSKWKKYQKQVNTNLFDLTDLYTVD